MDWESCVAVIGAITGILGAIISIISIQYNRFLAIHQYMETLETPGFIKARIYVHNIDPDQIPLDSQEASQVVNFFHHWGLLTKKHYLSLWIFDSGSGAGVIRYYECTQKYIEKRRTIHNDSTYAKNFEWLYNKLKYRRIKKGW